MLDQVIRFTEHYNKAEVIKDFESEILGNKPKLDSYKFDITEFQTFIKEDGKKKSKKNNED